MTGLEHPLQHHLGHGIRAETADVPPLGDHAMDGLARSLGKAPAAGIRGPP